MVQRMGERVEEDGSREWNGNVEESAKFGRVAGEARRDPARARQRRFDLFERRGGPRRRYSERVRRRDRGIWIPIDVSVEEEFEVLFEGNFASEFEGRLSSPETRTRTPVHDEFCAIGTCHAENGESLRLEIEHVEISLTTSRFASRPTTLRTLTSAIRLSYPRPLSIHRGSLGRIINADGNEISFARSRISPLSDSSLFTALSGSDSRSYLRRS